jgi:hypothetical protein
LLILGSCCEQYAQTCANATQIISNKSVDSTSRSAQA